MCHKLLSLWFFLLLVSMCTVLLRSATTRMAGPVVFGTYQSNTILIGAEVVLMSISEQYFYGSVVTTTQQQL